MIIGNGLLGKSLKNYDRENLIFIAAGVSDSTCKDQSEYDREKTLIRQLVREYPDKTLVYFSTFSITDPVMRNNPYVKAKLELEEYLKTHCRKYLIVRISNLVGHGGNPKNLFNFFFDQISSGRKFPLWINSRRNLIMVDDFIRILEYIINYELEEKKNTILNIVNARTFSVLDIVKAIEQHTGQKASFDPVDIASAPDIIDPNSQRMFEILDIDTDYYLERILTRYYTTYKLAL